MRMKVSRFASAIGVATFLFVCAGAANAQAVPPKSSIQESLPVPEAPAAASGAAPLPTMSDSFSDLDRDKDGALTPSEADRNESVATAFERLDENRDGRLDLAEFAQLHLHGN